MNETATPAKTKWKYYIRYKKFAILYLYIEGAHFEIVCEREREREKESKREKEKETESNNKPSLSLPPSLCHIVEKSYPIFKIYVHTKLLFLGLLNRYCALFHIK